jgi:hypothetical protein
MIFSMCASLLALSFVIQSMSVLGRQWRLLSILAGTCVVYSEAHHRLIPPIQRQPPPSGFKPKPTIILPLPPTKSYDRPLLLSVTSLESSKTNDNDIMKDQDDGIIEKARANFLELQDQLVEAILSKVSMVENFQVLSAGDLRDALTNLWDTVTLADIVDSVKDVKDTVANPELNKDAVVR